MAEHADERSAGSGSLRSAQLRFLQAELGVATAMLDLADSIHDAAIQEGRRALAEEACGVVADRLAPDAPGLALTEKDREELTAELWAITRRLRAHARPAPPSECGGDDYHVRASP